MEEEERTATSTAYVFISYAREDVSAAQRLANDLRKHGFDVWLDIERIAPGDRWEPAIHDALRASSYCIVLLSPNAITPTSYAVREISVALAFSSELLQTDRFFLPARLVSVQVSDKRLFAFQYVDLFPSWDDGVAKLCAAMSTTAVSVRERIPWKYVLLGASLPMICIYGYLAYDLFTGLEGEPLGVKLFILAFGTVLPAVLLSFVTAGFASKFGKYIKSKRAAIWVGAIAGLTALLIIMVAGGGR